MTDLTKVSIAQLIAELESRTDINTYRIPPYESYSIMRKNKSQSNWEPLEVYDGPVTILTTMD